MTTRLLRGYKVSKGLGDHASLLGSMVPGGGLEPPSSCLCQSFVVIAPTRKSCNTTSVLCIAQLVPKIFIAYETSVGYNNQTPPESLFARNHALVSAHTYRLLIRTFRLNFALAHSCAKGEFDEEFRPNCIRCCPVASPGRRVCHAPQSADRRASRLQRSLPGVLLQVGA
jgi:hypothetical protein